MSNLKPKQIIKIVIDILMTVLLLLLMAYSLAGEVLHEWLGIGMFVLFVLHHVLNSRWSRNLLKGSYTPFRILQTMLVILALVCMLGSMMSGIVISRHVFSFLPIHSGKSQGRTVHMLSAYWGFVVISLHLGLHWDMMLGMAKKMIKKQSAPQIWMIRGMGFLIACYGVFAFIKREIGSYMFLKTSFVYFDFEQPFIFFLLDYMAVMGLFVFIGYHVSRIFRKNAGHNKKGEREF